MDIHEGLRQSKAFAHTFLSCVQHAILATDMAGKIAYANPAVADFFGHLPDELAGKDLSILFTPEDMNFLYPNLLHLAGRGESFEGEIAFVRKDKTRFLAYVMFKPFCRNGTDLEVILVSIQFVDGRKAQEAPFNQDHCRELVKLADGIAHEMRNPIVGIGGFAKRLWKSQEPGSSATYYEGIMDNLRRLEGLVEKVELFARLPKPYLSSVSPKDVAEKAVLTYSQQAEDRGIFLSPDLQDASLFLDKGLVSRAISILIENAMDAVAGGGEIRISGKLADNEYRIIIMDTGCGISPQDLPHIFDPFYRTKPGGVGIDLTVVKRVVESQGGRVEVTSEPAKGTTFTLVFPVERRRSVRTCRLGK